MLMANFSRNLAGGGATLHRHPASRSFLSSHAKISYAVIDMALNVDVQIKREKKWFVIRSDKFHITTQGKSMAEAMANFLDAFSLCYTDADWLSAHGMASQGKAYSHARLLKKDRRLIKSPVVFNVSGQIADYIGAGTDKVLYK